MISSLIASVRNLFMVQWKYRIRYLANGNRWVIELNEGGNSHTWVAVCENNAEVHELVPLKFGSYQEAARYVLTLGLNVAYTEQRYTTNSAPGIQLTSTEAAQQDHASGHRAEVRALNNALPRHS